MKTKCAILLLSFLLIISYLPFFINYFNVKDILQISYLIINSISIFILSAIITQKVYSSPNDKYNKVFLVILISILIISLPLICFAAASHLNLEINHDWANPKNFLKETINILIILLTLFAAENKKCNEYLEKFLKYIGTTKAQRDELEKQNPLAEETNSKSQS